MHKTEIEKTVKTIIARDFVNWQEEEVVMALPLTAKLVGDKLYLDSLDMVELVMAIETDFAIEIPDKDAGEFKTIGDVVNYLAAHSA